MPTNADSRIRDLIERFAADLTGIVREAALESLASSFGLGRAQVAAAAPMPMAMGGGLVQDVIAQQMQIMREQLALLAGAAAPVGGAPK